MGYGGFCYAPTRQFWVKKSCLDARFHARSPYRTRAILSLMQLNFLPELLGGCTR
jgi:hypothetical protein